MGRNVERGTRARRHHATSPICGSSLTEKDMPQISRDTVTGAQCSSNYGASEGPVSKQIHRVGHVRCHPIRLEWTLSYSPPTQYPSLNSTTAYLAAPHAAHTVLQKNGTLRVEFHYSETPACAVGTGR